MWIWIATLYIVFIALAALAVRTAGAAILVFVVAAFVLGVRHAFDADHIAVIDASTRLLISQGRKSGDSGFYFALGHSSIVVVLGLITTIAVRFLVSQGGNNLLSIGGTIAKVFAIAFLAAIVLLNTLGVRQLIRTSSDWRRGTIDDEELECALSRRGPLGFVLGDRLQTAIGKPSRLFFVGLVMGLGMETASEVALMAVTATVGSSVDVPVWIAPLILPLAFACGMVLFDTLDSTVISQLYRWRGNGMEFSVRFGVTTGVLTVAVASIILVVSVGSLMADSGVPGFGWAAFLADRFEVIGYGIVVVFLALWASLLIVVARSRVTPNAESAPIAPEVPYDASISDDRSGGTPVDSPLTAESGRALNETRGMRRARAGNEHESTWRAERIW
ncbi:hypothetical protein [Brachybacterium epidermidis]|uniref:HoxN/HupN/NixA family nickel/cobalt transporter n=1 Tax=Brachybacterium epidermidis TaxID=2781983 RepID=UPI00398F11DD